MFKIRRFLVKGRQLSSAALYLPGFVLGLFIFGLFTRYEEILLLIFSLLLCIYKCTFVRVNILMFAVGAYLMGVPPPELEIKEGLSYRATIIETPRYRKPGEIEVSLLIDGVLTEDVVTEVTLVKVLARGQDLPWRNSSLLRRGDVVFVVLKPKFFKTRAPFSRDGILWRKKYSGYAKIVFISESLIKNDNTIIDRRDAFYRRFGLSEVSGFFLSLTLGVRDTLSSATERAFRSLGLSHILVLSGLQITALFYAVSKLIWKIIIPIKLLRFNNYIRIIPPITAIMIVLWFTDLTGADSSSVRAALAGLIVGIGVVFARGVDLFHCIVTSFYILSALEPQSIYEPGVQLTYAALIGIYLGSFNKGGVLTQYFYVMWSCFLTTSSISVLWFEKFYPTAFFANCIISPIGTILTQLGLLLLFLDKLTFESLDIVILYFLMCIDTFLKIVVWLSENFSYEISLTPLWSVGVSVTLIGILLCPLKRSYNLEEESEYEEIYCVWPTKSISNLIGR